MQITYATPELFTVLGVNPILGPTFLPEEDRFGGDVYKVILSPALWQSNFSGDPNIVGRVVKLRQFGFTIVGVMPPGFRFPETCDVWATLQSGYSQSYGNAVNQRMLDRGGRFQLVVGHLKPGVTEAQAQGEPQALIASVRGAIQAVDPDTVIDQVKAMERIATESLWQRRLWGCCLRSSRGLRWHWRRSVFTAC